jgi:hypothetical protein
MDGNVDTASVNGLSSIVAPITNNKVGWAFNFMCYIIVFIEKFKSINTIC